MKYDITTSHMHTQHWIVDAENKDEAENKQTVGTQTMTVPIAALMLTAVVGAIVMLFHFVSL